MFSRDNPNEDLAPAIVGALFGVGQTSTEGYRESLEVMVRRTFTLKRFYRTTSLFFEGGYYKGCIIAQLLRCFGGHLFRGHVH